MALKYSGLFSDIKIDDGDQWHIVPLSNVKLVTKRRTRDYHCALADNEAVWDCGKTQQEAIGAWVLAHGADYGITVEVK